MLEAVHATPHGESTVARFAATAADYGFDGVVVRDRTDTPTPYDADRIRETYGIDVVRGVEIRGDNRGQVSGYLGSVRHDATIVLVRGGTTELNRFAVQQSHVDVLSHPLPSPAVIDHGMVRTAKENGVRIEIGFGSVLRSAGGRRVRAIQEVRDLMALIEKFTAPYVISAAPRSHLQLRAPRELFAVGETLGFEPGVVRDGLTEWERITDRNRTRQSPDFVSNGVRVQDSKEDQ